MQKHFTIQLSGNFYQKGYKLRVMMLATQNNIKGSVEEREESIQIEAEGNEADLSRFYKTLVSYKNAENPDQEIQKNENHQLAYFEDFIIK